MLISVKTQLLLLIFALNKGVLSEDESTTSGESGGSASATFDPSAETPVLKGDTNDPNPDPLSKQQVVNEIVDLQKPKKGEGEEVGEKAAPEVPCDKTKSEMLSLLQLCLLPPDKGTGNDDIFRYYFNPVVQQCIPFSYSGLGGNANRFVSVKNCYEICHPALPSVKKARVVSGIKAYLVPQQKQCTFQSANGRNGDKEVIVRQIPNPLDPTKILTIIQDKKYVEHEGQQVVNNHASNMAPNDNKRPSMRSMVNPYAPPTPHPFHPYYYARNPYRRQQYGRYEAREDNEWNQNSIYMGNKFFYYD